MDIDFFALLPIILCGIVAVYMFTKSEGNIDFVSKFWQMVTGIIFILITVCMLKCTNNIQHKPIDDRNVPYNYYEDY